MISIGDIPEMLREMRAGTLSFKDISSLCLDLFEHNEVDAVLAALPDRLRDDIVADMTSTFDNDIPLDDFMIFSSARGDHPAKSVIIDRVRRWLGARKAHGEG
jgi:hypothetical protein